MDDSHRPQKVRVLKTKRLAEIARDMLQDKSDMPQIEASLNRVSALRRKIHYVEGEVLDTLVSTQLVLTKAVHELAKEVASLRSAKN
jgi:hypothetical protein